MDIPELYALFAENLFARWIAAIAFFLIFGAIYRQIIFNGGNIAFIVIVTGMTVGFAISPIFQLGTVMVLGFLLPFVVRYKKQRDKFFPANIVVEGGGVRRGLMPVEVASLLDRPFSEIMRLLLLDLMKKRLLVVEDASAFLLKPALDFDGGPIDLRTAAFNAGVILCPYDEYFLMMFGANPGKSLQEMDFSVLEKLIGRHVLHRMAGYDKSQTIAYYHQVIERSLIEARAAGELVTDYQDIYFHNLGWILLNGDDSRMLTVDLTPKWLQLPANLDWRHWLRELENAFNR